MPRNPALIAKLALVRYMLDVAESQRQQPEPVSGLAIMTIHDAIELFMNLASESAGAGKVGKDFMALFDALETSTGTSFVHKEGMRRLNKSRVNAKHYGTFPSRADLSEFADLADSFVRANCDLLFGLPFESISLVVLVTTAELRECLESALAQRDLGEFEEAMVLIAEAFARLQQLLPDDRDLMSDVGRVARHITELSPPDRGYPINSEIVHVFERVAKRLWLLEHGIDRRELQLFTELVPHVGFVLSGDRFVQSKMRKTPLQREELEFCFGFVLRTILRVQDAEGMASQVLRERGRRSAWDV